MSKVHHFSESEDGKAMQSNSFVDSILDSSKLLHLVLTEWVYELTLKIYYRVASDAPLSLCAHPHAHSSCMTKEIPIRDKTRVLLWLAVSGGLLGLQKQQQRERLTDVFIFFPPAAGGFYRVYQLWRDCSFLLCHSWWGLCCQTHCEYY